MNTKIKNEYTTSDLSLASALAVFFPVVGIREIDDKRKEFVFENTTQLAAAMEDYWNGTMLVNPVEHFNAVKDLKRRLYVQK